MFQRGEVSAGDGGANGVGHGGGESVERPPLRLLHARPQHLGPLHGRERARARKAAQAAGRAVDVSADDFNDED